MTAPKNGRAALVAYIQDRGSVLIGQRLRRCRESRELSLRDVSAISGLSKNTVLRAEQGLPIQIDSLINICRGLKLSVVDLVSQDCENHAKAAIHRAKNDAWYDMNNFVPTNIQPLSEEYRKFLSQQNNGVTAFNPLWSRSNHGKFNPNIVELNHQTPRRSHRGEEWVMVLEGHVRLTIGIRKIDLGRYESCFFNAGEQHHYEPLGETLPVVLLSIVLDPFPNLEEFKMDFDQTD